MTSRRCNIATLADVGCTSYDLNVTTLRHENVMTLRLGSLSISFFKSPHSFQMPSFSPEMHKKPSIRYTTINILITR